MILGRGGLQLALKALLVVKVHARALTKLHHRYCVIILGILRLFNENLTLHILHLVYSHLLNPLIEVHHAYAAGVLLGVVDLLPHCLLHLDA